MTRQRTHVQNTENRLLPVKVLENDAEVNAQGNSESPRIYVLLFIKHSPQIAGIAANE